MPARFRIALILIGGFLILNGVAVAVIAVASTSGAVVRGVVSGIIALACGVVILRAVYVRRGPRWLVQLLDE